jgi:protein TonB
MNNLLLRQDDENGFWRALPWAVLLWLFAIWLAGRFLMTAPVPAAVPQEIDAQIIEQITEQSPSPAAAPAPLKAPMIKPIEPLPVLEKTAVSVPLPSPPVVKTVVQAVAAPSALTPPTLAPPTAPTTSNGPYGTENHGALAVFKPDPQIPDDLLGAANGQQVTARFHISADGSLTVELLKKTSDPRLNRSILETLKKWRFEPAVQAKKAVATIQDVAFSF